MKVALPVAFRAGPFTASSAAFSISLAAAQTIGLHMMIKCHVIGYMQAASLF
jgi:hypothetical protein